jgi:uncharacterized protein YjbI with pentapeptide repeats
MNDLPGANFVGQNLTNAIFSYAKLTDADFTGADVRGANFAFHAGFSGGITLTQLYSTESYQAHDLSAINLEGGNLAGATFADQNLTQAGFADAALTGASFREANLTNANFENAKLTDADFTDAEIRGARFYKGDFGTGLSLSQLYSTASYQAKDLRGIQGLYLSAGITTNLILPDGHIDGLNLTAGEKLVAYPGVPIPVQVSGGFSIAPNATFDLTDNDLIVRATAETKDALHADVQAKIKSAQNGADANGLTNWNGPGITSSSARATNVAIGFDLTGLGVIRNSDLDITTGLPGSAYTTFSGQPVTRDDVLVKYTYIGDGNLDGIINFDDYIGMDNAFFQLIPNLGWATGDINFDNVINFDDYCAVDQAFFFQDAPLTSAANGPSAVPEPASLAILAAATLLTLSSLSRRAGTRRPSRPR